MACRQREEAEQRACGRVGVSPRPGREAVDSGQKRQEWSQRDGQQARDVGDSGRVRGVCAWAPEPPSAHPPKTTPHKPRGGLRKAWGARAPTTTIWNCSWLQCLGRMGRMVGGSRMPSSMWITPLAASTSTLRSGTPSGPSRMRPCARAQCVTHPASRPSPCRHHLCGLGT